MNNSKVLGILTEIYLQKHSLEKVSSLNFSMVKRLLSGKQ